MKINRFRQIPTEEQEIFKDTTYLIGDYFNEYAYNFNKYIMEDQKTFQKYATVSVRIKKDSYNKEHKTTVSQKFDKVADIADLYKAEDYADDIKFNYALTAEQHYYSIHYSFENNIFKRVVMITNKEIAKEHSEKIDSQMVVLKKFSPIEIYKLNYTFPKPIKSVSNNNAKISEEKKVLILEFKLSDCVKNP